MSDTESRASIGRKRVPIPIRLKLIAALVVPLVAVASLCWVQVSQARDRVKEVEAETALARTALAPGGLVDALIVEQGDAVVSPLDLRATATFPTDNWAESTAATDAALSDFRAGLVDGGPVAQELFESTIDGIEAALKTQRAASDRMLAEPGLVNLVEALDEVYPSYSAIINELIDANDALAEAISDPEMRRAAQVLNAVNEVHYNVSGLMSSVGTGILRPGNEGRDPVVAFLSQYEASINNLRSQTDGPWEPAVSAFAANEKYQQIIDRGRDFLETSEIDLNAYIALNPPVGERATAANGTTQRVAQEANEDLTEIIDARLDDARSEEQRYTYLAVGVLLLATAAALFVARSIIRPMRKLTEQAEEMAAITLPNAVKGILETPAHQDVVLPELAPISVKSRDELQTVATAINHVQVSALDLAVEQATLRRNIADSFVSLGRRTQNLISLQLELITNLERDEADPAQLESLYRLDHLATRARRNAESLVVLGGTTTQQTGGSPVAMTDIIRAMLSEVEAYQRVDITGVDVASLPGSAAADAIHLLAELVENGLSFSPPTTQVEVVGRRDEKGYTIAITDHGVGMTADKLTQANRRLADNESFTVAPSRYLGHYVTGKLARRVGASVSLASGASGGVVATVFVPANKLVTDLTTPAQAIPGPSQDDATPTTADNFPTDPFVPDSDPALGVKVDGRPPAIETASANHSANAAHSSNGSTAAEPPAQVPAPSAPAASTADADAADGHTEAGLRKRVPGVHAQAVRERSPLLRSAANRSADQAPLGAETSPQAAENLANLLGDYTSGLERGRADHVDAVNNTEPSE